MASSVEGIHYKTNRSIKIDLKGNFISEVHHTEHQVPDSLIAPGLVDIQVNGFMGIDFNKGALSTKEIRTITEALWQHGTTTYFPTLITNSDAHIHTALKSIVKACKDDRLVNDSIGGIHLEGPFLSPEDGPRGAHPLQYIKAPDWTLFENWQTSADGKIKLITLAPEWPEASDFIKKCTASGVLVSIGHTAATPEQIEKAIASGARMATHLGNAAHLMLPRHPNYIWEQLSSEGLWSSIIADGFHLPESVLKVFLKVKPETNVLISDATRFAGLPPGTYSSHIGGKIELDASGRLFMKDSPKLLAGSAQSLLKGIDHLVNSGIVSLDRALEMASLKPMELLNNDELYGLKKGSMADLILFRRHSDKMQIVRTIKSGETVYSA